MRNIHFIIMTVFIYIPFSNAEFDVEAFNYAADNCPTIAETEHAEDWFVCIYEQYTKAGIKPDVFKVVKAECPNGHVEKIPFRFVIDPSLTKFGADLKCLFKGGLGNPERTRVFTVNNEYYETSETEEIMRKFYGDDNQTNLSSGRVVFKPSFKVKTKVPSNIYERVKNGNIGSLSIEELESAKRAIMTERLGGVNVREDVLEQLGGGHGGGGDPRVGNPVR